MARARKWVLRVGLIGVLALTVVATWAAMNASFLKARYAARQLRNATTDEDRARAADQLAGLGDPGFAELVGLLKTGNDPCRAAAVGGIDRHLAALPVNDPRAVTRAGQVLDAASSCDEPCRRAVLELLPTILKQTGNTHAARCRELVAQGLKTPDPTGRMIAVRLALHPEMKLQPALLPLLAAPEAEVRRTALVALATSNEGDSLLGDEELFRWLHDPDEGVRRVCHEALVGRDRSDTEIALGQRLTHPDPTERLKLLLDLRYDDDVADPEPWLERLSRDPEPAVRAGAARVAVEVSTMRRLPCPGWVGRVAASDADPTVRRIVHFYHRQVGTVRQLSSP